MKCGCGTWGAGIKGRRDNVCIICRGAWLGSKVVSVAPDGCSCGLGGLAVMRGALDALAGVLGGGLLRGRAGGDE